MSGLAWGEEPTQFFYSLTPERVLEAVEKAGFRCTGRCLPLGSMENRVYDVELEFEEGEKPALISARSRVVKFYRPGRWTEEQIREEHRFLLELEEEEVPVVAPLRFPNGDTLQREEGSQLYYALFPKVGGRSPDEFDFPMLERIGRLLARIHIVGSRSPAPSRVRLNPSTYGRASLRFLLESGTIPPPHRERYTRAVEDLCTLSEPWFDAAKIQRIHGDCHRQNLLWNDAGPFFLDFDDMVQGPPVQDFWLLIPGRDVESKQQLDVLVEAYEELRPFDRSTLRLIEPLRALRWIHFSAWIAKRWEDPAFPRGFPQFAESRYWEEQVLDLEDQLSYLRGRSEDQR